MYEFVSGPLVWMSFLIFIGGSIYQLVTMYTLAKKEKVVLPYMSLKFGLRSIFHWVIPFATKNWRLRPIMTVATFTFHFCLLLTPLFLLPHVLLIRKAWNISWFTLPEPLADFMTVLVMLACVFFLARRLILPEVKFVTSKSDYILLAITVLPFVTGFLSYHQILHYKSMVVFHILSGEAMLIAIPFTRLGHMIYFAFTRSYMGSEFGNVRNSKDW